MFFISIEVVFLSFAVLILANCVIKALFWSMKLLESLIFGIHFFFIFCEIMEFLFEFPFFCQKAQNDLASIDYKLIKESKVLVLVLKKLQNCFF